MTILQQEYFSLEEDQSTTNDAVSQQEGWKFYELDDGRVDDDASLFGVYVTNQLRYKIIQVSLKKIFFSFEIFSKIY